MTTLEQALEDPTGHGIEDWLEDLSGREVRLDILRLVTQSRTATDAGILKQRILDVLNDTK